MGSLLFMKPGKSKKMPKIKKKTHIHTQNSLGKAKKCLKKKTNKEDYNLSLPTLFVELHKLFYSQDKLKTRILLLKVCLIHWDVNIFFRNTQCPSSWKNLKKLVVAEGGGRSHVWNLCCKLCCFFLPPGRGVQRLRQCSDTQQALPSRHPQKR